MSLETYKQVIHEDFSKEANLIDSTIKKLKLKKNAKILDVGTGIGAMSILLALNSYSVLTGQPDHDPEWEENKHRGEQSFKQVHCSHEGKHDNKLDMDWKENAKKLRVVDKITFQYLDAQNLDFVDESFDAVFMYDTLQHIKNRESALNECLRVLKSCGLVCVIEWNEKNVKEHEEKYGFRIDYIDPNEILHRDAVSIELIPGDSINIFIIRKELASSCL